MDSEVEENSTYNQSDQSDQVDFPGTEAQESRAQNDALHEQADSRDNSRYQDGQLLRFVRVRFPGNARSFPFHIGKRNFTYGQKVVASSDRGMTVGYINSFPYDVTYSKEIDPVRSIVRVATEEDFALQKDCFYKEKEAEKACLKLIEKYRLDMVLTHVEFIQFGKKAVFYFNAPSRVDFRDLVKELVGDLRMRIELRQISVRDRTAAIGAIGACGLQTCCSSFLTTYGNVSIKMAKNQNLALIPSKINGVCGQLKCCVKYEDDVYSDKRARLPRENHIVKLKNDDIGKVLRLNVLEEQFDMITDRGVIKRFTARVYNPKSHSAGSDYRFPERFESVDNQTSQIVDWQIDDLVAASTAAQEQNDYTVPQDFDGHDDSAEITTSKEQEQTQQSAQAENSQDTKEASSEDSQPQDAKQGQKNKKHHRQRFKKRR